MTAEVMLVEKQDIALVSHTVPAEVALVTQLVPEITVVTQATVTSLVQQIEPKITLITAGVGLQGPPGPRGLAGTALNVELAQVDIGGHTAVVMDLNGRCIIADPTNPHHFSVTGITANAVIAGNEVELVTTGSLEHLGWTFTVGSPIFLGLAGVLTQTLPINAVFSKVLGTAVSPTRVSLDFQPAIFK